MYMYTHTYTYTYIHTQTHTQVIKAYIHKYMNKKKPESDVCRTLDTFTQLHNFSAHTSENMDIVTESQAVGSRFSSRTSVIMDEKWYPSVNTI